MPELLQIRIARILRRLDAERRVAARAAGAGEVVFHLHVGRQREETLERVVGAIDQRLRDAVAADAGETPFAIGRAELGDERVAIGVVAADVEGGDA